MVLGVHYKRSVHVDGHSALEEISNSVFSAIHAKHHQNYRIAFLHYGPFFDYNNPKGLSTSCGIHRRFTRSQLGSYVLFRIETKAL